MAENLCQRCGKREADYENIICSQCKAEIDREDFELERKAYEADMLQRNHKGEWCWLTGQGKVFCQEGWCSECAIYQGWKASLENIEMAQNMLPVQKEAFRKAKKN